MTGDTERSGAREYGKSRGMAPPRPVRRVVAERARQKRRESLQFVAIAVLIGLALVWALYAASAPGLPVPPGGPLR